MPSPCFEIGSLIAMVVFPPVIKFQYKPVCTRVATTQTHESIAQKRRSMASNGCVFTILITSLGRDSQPDRAVSAFLLWALRQENDCTRQGGRILVRPSPKF